ncbi:hypothetical protein EJF36_04735 [Bacillus sp. HMF5848]|uniref:GerAB/ArcD/ProY family transporter n=1 Tax=Bacillus sp. HMF5848 TaxID=2495421 RepID=UPI000F77F876|nr:GerAB/ArcD/ProY family transporter [Bacillus sp. HMF5848]RSK26218.1 hypothetical protein EJF36_04735 [Bacillus sp. HMF5848]
MSNLHYRYFYYLVAINMLSNVVAYIPKILIENRLDGSVMAIGVASVLGFSLLFWHVKLIAKFPNKTILEIMEGRINMPVTVVVSFLYGLLWLVAGLVTVVAFSTITKRFINPEIPEEGIAALFLILVCAGALLESKRVLYMLEVVLVLNLPFLVLLFIKAYANNYFQWDAVRTVLTHYADIPSWYTLSAAAYTISGFINIMIFNSGFKELKPKFIYLVPLVAIANLFTTLMVPIGFHGVDGVEDYNYIWITTSDALRFEFGFVERVVFVFLLIYISISLMSVIIHWHVAVEFFKSHLPKIKKNNKPRIQYVIVLVFSGITILVIHYFNENTILILTKLWLSLLIPFGLLANILLTYLVRKEHKKI